MATARAYRTPRPPATIRAELLACRGVRYDPALIDVVLKPTVWSALWADVYPAIPDDLAPSQGATDSETEVVPTTTGSGPAPLPVALPSAIRSAPLVPVLLRDALPSTPAPGPNPAPPPAPTTPTPTRATDRTAADHGDTSQPPDARSRNAEGEQTFVSPKGSAGATPPALPFVRPPLAHHASAPPLLASVPLRVRTATRPTAHPPFPHGLESANGRPPQPSRASAPRLPTAQPTPAMPTVPRTAARPPLAPSRGARAAHPRSPPAPRRAPPRTQHHHQDPTSPTTPTTLTTPRPTRPTTTRLPPRVHHGTTRPTPG